MFRSKQFEEYFFEERIRKLQNFLEEYDASIDQMYPKNSKSGKPVHYKSQFFREAFVCARFRVKSLEDINEKYSTKVKKLKDEINKCKEKSHENTSPKYSELNHKLKCLTTRLSSIQCEIRKNQAELAEAQRLYEEKGKQIIQEMQKYQKKRLALMNETIVKYFDLMAPPDDMEGLREKYKTAWRRINVDHSVEHDVRNWIRYFIGENEDEDVDGRLSSKSQLTDDDIE